MFQLVIDPVDRPRFFAGKYRYDIQASIVCFLLRILLADRVNVYYFRTGEPK